MTQHIRTGTRQFISSRMYKASFSSHKTIDVLPVLHNQQKGATMELKPFSLAIKNPMKSIIELCLNLSSNDAVLPVLVTLMLHCKGEREKSNFQGPQFDRILSTLVGSRPPGSARGFSIKDILLPKGRKAGLADLCKEYQLAITEEQVNTLKHGKRAARHTADRTKREALQFCEDITLPSSSTPNATASPSADLSSSIESLKEEATAVYRVKQGVYASDPQALSLKAGDEVYVLDSSSEVWYGVCEDKRGYFDSRHVKLAEISNGSHTMPGRSASSSPQPPRPHKGSYQLCEPLTPHIVYSNTLPRKSEDEITGVNPMVRFPEGLSMSAHADLNKAGIGAPSEEPLHSECKPLPPLPVKPAAKVPLSPHLKRDVKPKPRPRLPKKPITDVPDRLQGIDTSEDNSEEHEYEDIDDLRPHRENCMLPPRTLRRLEQPPRAPLKPPEQRRMTAPDQALQVELKHRVHRERTQEPYIF